MYSTSILRSVFNATRIIPPFLLYSLNIHPLFLIYTTTENEKKNAATKRNVPSHFFFRDQYNAHSLRPLRHRYRVGPAIFSGTIEEQAHDSGCSTTPGHLPACRPTDLILARASTKLYVAHGNIIINSDNYRY